MNDLKKGTLDAERLAEEKSSYLLSISLEVLKYLGLL